MKCFQLASTLRTLKLLKKFYVKEAYRTRYFEFTRTTKFSLNQLKYNRPKIFEDAAFHYQIFTRFSALD